jgi:hypothetical protein
MAHATPTPDSQPRYTTADLSKIADHLITVMADDPHVTDTQLDVAVRSLYSDPRP